MKKTFWRAVFALILGVIVIALFLYARGYFCYKKATKNASLEDKVNQIRSSEKFVSWDEMPDDYKNAVIAVEDHRFKEHGTVDFIAIARALTSNFRKKELAEGGSTITQQVVKNLYFMEADTKNDSLDRKIAEIIMGAQLEKKYSKEEIFELYANNIYFGDGYYCLKDAAKGYFGKEPKDLNLDECTMLAGIPNAPSVYSPSVNPDLARQRQQKVLSSMVKYHYITQEQADLIK